MELNPQELADIIESVYKQARRDTRREIEIEKMMDKKDDIIEKFAKDIHDRDIRIKSLQDQIKNTTLIQPQRAVPKMPKAPEAIDDDIPF